MALKKTSFNALFQKSKAELSGGYYEQGSHDTIADAHRSRYNTRLGTLGMGFVQALLAVLSAHVSSFEWKEQGKKGVATLMSTSGHGEYYLSWDESDPSSICYGNFQNGPTYQMAMLGLIACFLDQQVRGGSIQSEEVMLRWYDLVETMQAEYNSTFTGRGWPEATVEQACCNPAIQPHIEMVGDALWFALRYQIILPASSPSHPTPSPSIRAREVLLDKDAHVVDFPLHGSVGNVEALFVRPLSLMGGFWHARSSPGLVSNEVVARIAAILDEGNGPLMLVGPHGTGKSIIPLQIAIERGWGVEHCVLDDGWEAIDLFGSMEQEQGGASRFLPGKLYRWAQRVLAALASDGGRVTMLLIDEFTRGHRTVRSPLMNLLNQYTAEQVLVQDLPVPQGELGPFHILDVRDTQERLVLPARLLRLVFACNWGGSYQTSVSLEDPALRSRFRGGWVHVSEYRDPDAAEILARNLRQVAPRISSQAELIWRILDVRRSIKEDQALEMLLLSHLDMRTMLSWAEKTITRLGHSPSSQRNTIQQVFLSSALDTWIDMFCPMSGAELDENVRSSLINKVREQGRNLSALDSTSGL